METILIHSLIAAYLIFLMRQAAIFEYPRELFLEWTLTKPGKVRRMLRELFFCDLCAAFHFAWILALCLNTPLYLCLAVPIMTKLILKLLSAAASSGKENAKV